MGKRKLGNLHYFSCDYTGFPMAEQSCYCPHWDATDRLQKKGNFCNWESVWGFAIKNTPDPAELTKVREHLIEVCGKLPEEPPAQEELAHIKTLEHKGCLTTSRHSTPTDSLSTFGTWAARRRSGPTGGITLKRPRA